MSCATLDDLGPGAVLFTDIGKVGPRRLDAPDRFDHQPGTMPILPVTSISVIHRGIALRYDDRFSVRRFERCV